MNTQHDLRHRQFFWGLSNGVIVLTLATAYWFGLAAASGSSAWMLPIAVLIGVSLPALLFGAIRVRRKAGGFGIADLKRAEGTHREEIRRIRAGFRWTTLAQTAMVSTAVGLAMHYQRQDLVWPGIALAVSLHFIPLGWLFHMRAYYVTALGGSAISLGALLAPAALLDAPARAVYLGLGMGASVSITAVYAVLRADRLVTMWDDAH